MKSAMCKGEEHQHCGKVMQLPPGKTFRCDCECHKPAEKPWEDFDVDELVEQQAVR